MMSAEKVIYDLLSKDTELLKKVPKVRIYPSLIPLGTTLPAIAYMLVSSVEQTAIGLTTNRRRSRVQVTVAANTYPQAKEIVSLVEGACNHKQGTFNGVQTDSVILDSIGADFRDDDNGTHYSTIDFRIAYSD
jgi:hypothetical protein